MIALIQTSDSVSYEVGRTPDDMVSYVEAPSIGTGTYLTDHGELIVVSSQGDMLLNGPYIIKGRPHYIADIPAAALPALQAQLGISKARRYIDALRDTPPVRAHAQANFRAHRNASAKAVSYAPPLTFCGHSDVDMDEDPDDAPELT